MSSINFLVLLLFVSILSLAPLANLLHLKKQIILSKINKMIIAAKINRHHKHHHPVSFTVIKKSIECDLYKDVCGSAIKVNFILHDGSFQGKK